MASMLGQLLFNPQTQEGSFPLHAGARCYRLSRCGTRSATGAAVCRPMWALRRSRERSPSAGSTGYSLRKLPGLGVAHDPRQTPREDKSQRRQS